MFEAFLSAPRIDKYEPQEMSEEVEDRSLEEELDFEGTENQFSESGKSKIKYKRASLLEFNEVEVCRKLPEDFDLLVLRLLDEVSDGTREPKKISGVSSLHGLLPSPRWNLGSPGERWENQLLMPSKESYSQGNCGSEGNDVICHQNAGILGRKIQNSDLFQFRKSENPYRPPHCNAKMQQSLDIFSEHEVESSGSHSISTTETDRRGSADSITEIGSINSPHHEQKDSWKYNERSGMFGSKLELGGVIDDNQLFDDFWSEILEMLQLQQESKLTPICTPDSEVEICWPDAGSLILPDYSTLPENLNSITLDNGDDVANSEAEIKLPDEDSLISIDDMLAPHSSLPTRDRNTMKDDDKVASNVAVNIRKNPESLNVSKQDNRYTTLSCQVDSFHDFSGLVTHGKLYRELPHTQTSGSFGPEKASLHIWNDHMSSLSNFITPNIIPYLPTLNCSTCSTFHDPSCQDIIFNRTKANTLVQYSLLQQPNICTEQQNHLQIDSCPINQAAIPDSNAMQYLHLASPQTGYQSFGKSNAGVFAEKMSSGFWYAQH